MDLQLVARVVWRFRLLVAMGLLLAVTLAALSVLRVGPDGVAYRESELYASSSRLLVTQRGFPWGRAVPEQTGATAEEQARQLGVQFANPDRFISLAVLYAQLATSDAIRDVMLKTGPIVGEILASPVVAQNNVSLPLIDIVGVAPDPIGAIKLGERATQALSAYLERQQNANHVPRENRIVVQVLSRPQPPQLFQGRSFTLSIVVFLTTLIATIGLAFVLENVRPRVHVVSDADTPPADAARRSA